MAFKWTAKKIAAAQLIAAGNLTEEQIAAEVGVTRETLRLWRKVPDFTARLDELLDSLREALKTAGIADKRNRLNAYNRRWEKLQAVIEARAVAYADGPGGDTGLLAEERKAIGSGLAVEFINVYTLDAALLKEIRELEKQAAIEMGEWTEKRDLTTNGNPILVYLPDNGRDKN